MNILCIDDPFRLSAAFAALGHTVFVARPDKFSPSLAQCIEESGFTPDLVLQQEHLGRHVLVEGMERAPCPTMFLSIDAHLNLFWERFYARLFDAVLTPHVSLFDALPPEWRHPLCLRCPPVGHDYPWRPFAARSVDIAFCGRITPHRQVRKWMVELLGQRYGLVARENLSFGDMMDCYADARLVPNEAIAREVNFRLLEAASCGALVFSQNVGPDQDAVFTARKEIRVCGDGVELVKELDWFRRRPDQAEKLGRAAWERVRREHLPLHRAATILRFAKDLSANRATDGGHFWLACAQHARSLRQYSGMARLAEQRAERGGDLAARPECAAARIRLLAECGQKAQALSLCRELLDSNLFPGSLDFNCAASACALRLDDFPLARLFWLRHVTNSGDRARGKKISPQSPVALCRAWAVILRRAGRMAQSGFQFACESDQLPECAFEFLLLAYSLDENDPETLRHLDSLCATLPAYAEFRLGILARRCLQEPENRRLQQNYGKISLAVYRVDEGLFELAAAKKMAGMEH
ncbi:MAG: glycosyltransferase [Desulfovibrio sp.]|jgi:hypothetical protein|nr:glycosyltransferase [Desulfovibrio sp.]